MYNLSRNSRRATRLFVTLVLCVSSLDAANAQGISRKSPTIAESDRSILAQHDMRRTEPFEKTFESVYLQVHPLDNKVSHRNNIIIGFVGGYVKHNDLKHPEVQFASLLREIYAPSVHVEVFANHDGEEALRRVLQLLDSNGDGVITAQEKAQANIIIYGHSWGGSQTVALARALGLQGVPVMLTVQIDSVRKPAQEDSTIPPNVKSAVNFYQTKGLVRGRSTILAEIPAQTHIVGNFHIDYRNRRINCDNYPWLARHFNKPHHEIENDPIVWKQIASLIDFDLRNVTPMVEASAPSKSID